MPPTQPRPVPGGDEISERRPAAAAAPAARVKPGKHSRTRFLSVKKFRFARARTMLLIGVGVVLLAFVAWCGMNLLG